MFQKVSSSWLSYSLTHSFILYCLTTGPQPLSKSVLHRVRSSVSTFNLQQPLFSLRLSSNCLRYLPLLPFISIHPSIFPSIACCRRQVLRKMSPTQLTFLIFIARRIFLSSLTVCNNSSFFTLSVQLISILLYRHISKLSRYFWSTTPKIFFRNIPQRLQGGKMNEWMNEWMNGWKIYCGNHNCTQKSSNTSFPVWNVAKL